MMRFGEAVIFLLIASGLHAAVWTVSSFSPGTTAASASGPHDMSLVAASASQLAMVASWQRSPETMDRTPNLASQTTQIPPLASPQLPAVDAPAFLPPLSGLNIPQPPEIKSVVDTTPAPSLPVQDPPVKRPRPRPDDLAKAPEDSPAVQHRPERRAKGAAGQTSNQSKDADVTKALQAAWGSQIYAKVQHNLRHPKGMDRATTAHLVVTVTPGGKLEGLRLVRSSGHSKFDDAALRAVKKSGRFSKAPKGLDKASYAFSLALTFTP